MCQRSGSSVKGVHRGSQQKRISRQQLQSSSSRTEATAAAVAAARGEAAWRGLDRVRELCWQPIERKPQLGATTSEGVAEALSSGENPRPGGIGRSEARRCVFVAMGSAFTKIWERLVGKTDAGILVVKIDAAGQTTIVYKLKLGEMATTITTIGRRVEIVEYKNFCFAMRSAGGQDRI